MVLESLTSSHTRVDCPVPDSIPQVTCVPAEATPAFKNEGLAYPFYYPHSDPDEKLPPLEHFEHIDAGSRADPAMPHLLMDGVIVKHLSPYIGTEIKEVQISHLSKQGLDELALFVAERKMLVFRDQDFKDIGPKRQIEIARHFGPLHKHPTSGNVKGHQEFHVVYRDANHHRQRDHNRPGEYLGGDKANKMSWHSDITYEKQPPGTTILCMLEMPEIGGDTLFASQVEAYNRLSPEFRTHLEGLQAAHSARLRAEYNRTRNGPVRRESVESEHPIVRQHPVTGEKALFVNQGATKRIVGFKVEESECLLKFLFNHIATGADFQVRATYEPGTVVIWDNRVTVHSPVADLDEDARRHAVRLTPQAEVPIPA